MNTTETVQRQLYYKLPNQVRERKTSREKNNQHFTKLIFVLWHPFLPHEIPRLNFIHGMSLEKLSSIECTYQNCIYTYFGLWHRIIL